MTCHRYQKISKTKFQKYFVKNHISKIISKKYFSNCNYRFINPSWTAYQVIGYASMYALFRKNTPETKFVDVFGAVAALFVKQYKHYEVLTCIDVFVVSLAPNCSNVQFMTSMRPTITNTVRMVTNLDDWGVPSVVQKFTILFSQDFPSLTTRFCRFDTRIV